MSLSKLSFPNAFPSCRGLPLVVVGNPNKTIIRPPTEITASAGSRQGGTFGGDSFGIGFSFFVFFYFIFCCTSCQSHSIGDLVCFQEKCVQVEIAQKPEELNRGLQLREKLAEKTGMLFVFPRSALHSFWMKDTKIPLDLIWMDAVQQVVDIKKNVPPCVEVPCVVYTPDQEARYVLEINSGAADTLKIQQGDTAVFRFNSGKQF